MDNLKTVRDIFNLYDKDSEGFVLVKDLPNICKYLFNDNLSEEMIKQLFDISDIDSNKKISFEDFYTILLNKNDDLFIKRNVIEEAFLRFDKKVTGRVTKLDLKNIIEQSDFDQYEINEIIDSYGLAYNPNEEFDYKNLIEEYFNSNLSNINQ